MATQLWPSCEDQAYRHRGQRQLPLAVGQLLVGELGFVRVGQLESANCWASGELLMYPTRGPLRRTNVYCWPTVNHAWGPAGELLVNSSPFSFGQMKIGPQALRARDGAWPGGRGRAGGCPPAGGGRASPAGVRRGPPAKREGGRQPRRRRGKAPRTSRIRFL